VIWHHGYFEEKKENDMDIHAEMAFPFGENA